MVYSVNTYFFLVAFRIYKILEELCRCLKVAEGHQVNLGLLKGNIGVIYHKLWRNLDEKSQNNEVKEWAGKERPSGLKVSLTICSY